jgi:protein TonB
VAVAKARYQNILKNLIEKNKDYPLLARKAGREGTCAVRCALERNGSIRRVQIVKSSGHDLLDKSALRAVRNVGQFPPVPVEVKGDEVNFDVPISFSLTKN